MSGLGSTEIVMEERYCHVRLRMAMLYLLKIIIPLGRHPNLAEHELAMLGDTHCNRLIASGQGSSPAA
jgi:hypothetical protein